MSGRGKQEAVLLAGTLPLNETIYTGCPSCGGQKKFSVTRVRDGVLWNCFRASCEESGSTITHGAYLSPNKPKEKPLKTYNGATYPLTVEDKAYFYGRFHLNENSLASIRVAEDDRYALDVLDPRGYRRAMVLRNGWTGSPECPRKSQFTGPKSVVYTEVHGPMLSWYIVPDSLELVLVEDQLSALRAMQDGVSACALMGTQLDNNKVREIAMYRATEVIFALDADATEESFKLARNWGLAFDKTRVAILENDLKDEHNYIPEVLRLV